MEQQSKDSNKNKYSNDETDRCERCPDTMSDSTTTKATKAVPQSKQHSDGLEGQKHVIVEVEGVTGSTRSADNDDTNAVGKEQIRHEISMLQSMSQTRRTVARLRDSSGERQNTPGAQTRNTPADYHSIGKAQIRHEILSLQSLAGNSTYDSQRYSSQQCGKSGGKQQDRRSWQAPIQRQHQQPIVEANSACIGKIQLENDINRLRDIANRVTLPTTTAAATTTTGANATTTLPAPPQVSRVRVNFSDRPGAVSVTTVPIASGGFPRATSLPASSRVLDCACDFDDMDASSCTATATASIDAADTQTTVSSIIPHADLVEDKEIVEGIPFKKHMTSRWCNVFFAVGIIVFIVLFVLEKTRTEGFTGGVNQRTSTIVTFVGSITLEQEETATGSTLTEQSANRGFTPTQQTLRWIIDSDPLRLSPDSAVHVFRLQQRYALVTLWFHWSPSQWTNTTGWLEHPDECDWFGIMCKDMDKGEGVGVQRVVTEIQLVNNGLVGHIPPDIALLDDMVVLNLDSNFLVDSLPNSLGSLKRLESISMLSNTLAGRLPTSLRKLSNLKNFNIVFNRFTGPLPHWIGDWLNLRELNVGYNSFTGTIPSSVGNWNKIDSVMLSRNFFSGPLPQSISAWNPRQFAADSNLLTGPIPGAIAFEWTRMEYFAIHENKINGTVPSLEKWTNLADFDAKDNVLEGEVPFMDRYINDSDTRV